MKHLDYQVEPSLFATIDFRAFFETLRLRWWVLPVTIAVAFGFVQFQSTGLRTEPATYLVSRGYEMGSPFQTLIAVGINLDILEIPTADTQMLILKSNEVREEISQKVGADVEVQLPSTWETPATFTCKHPEKDVCLRAIDLYIEKVIDLRSSAVKTGARSLRSFLSDLQLNSQDSKIRDQIAALDAFSATIEIPLVQVDGFDQTIGDTVTDVRRPRLIISTIAGLMIGLLIILQLTYSDSRVRSVRQLLRLTRSELFLGQLLRKSDSIVDRRVALSLESKMPGTSVTHVRFIPLSDTMTDTTGVERLALLVGKSYEVSKPFSDLSVSSLTERSENEIDVLLVARNYDTRRDVLEAVVALSHTKRSFAGVVLIN